MSGHNKVRGTVKPELNVTNTVGVSNVEEINQYLRRQRKIVFDFSMVKAFNSCDVNGFNSYLKSDEDFVDKFRQILTVIYKLSEKTVSDLFSGNGYRHCHVSDD